MAETGVRDVVRSYDEILARLSRHLEQIVGPGVPIDESTEMVTQLGLDSVKVLDVILEIEDDFDISVPMNLLADVRTVRDLAQVIHKVLAATAGSQP